MKFGQGVLRLAMVVVPAMAMNTPTATAQFAHAHGEQILGRDGKPLLLRGINLGNWMVPEGYMWQLGGHVQSGREIERLVTELIGPERDRAFWATWRATYITRDDVRRIHEEGFNSIRVPLHYKLFASDPTETDGPPSESSEGFRMLDRLVEWSRSEGLYLVLDMHAAPGGQTGTNIDDSDGYPWLFTDATAQQQLVDTWARIARRYGDEPVVLGYDLLNEPIPTYPKLKVLNPLLEPLYKRVATAIRKQDKNHVLILGGAQWDNNFDVFGPPFDDNVVYEWHKYKVAVPDQKVVERYVAFRSKWHVPVWLGESGENTDAWVASFRETLERNDIGWAFWPYKKMGAASAVETIQPPDGWDAIVAYSKLHDGVGLAQQRLEQRPAQDVIDKAFAGLLENIQLAKCTENPGYVRALLPR